jgi:tripartite-type tricarboxylate transporter receptor subunit TctC
MKRLLLSCLLIWWGSTNPLMAQTVTAKPLRLIVPYAAGGPLDVTARVLAERVKDSLGPVVVENRPGAGGNLGMDLVAKSAPDGLTIGMAAVATHAINPWLFARMPYDASRDFAPITQVVRVPNVLVMNAATAERLGVRTLADLIRHAKAYPGQLNYGSGGNGSAGHLAGELFKRAAGIFVVHIPYNGGNPAQLALLSGQVDFNIDNLASAAPNIASGKLKALAVTTARRAASLPDLPSFSETLPGFEIDTWWGLVAAAGTPSDIVQRLNLAFTQALNDPLTRQRFASLMAEPTPSSAETFGQFMAKERAKYEPVVRASGARVD